MSSGTDVMDVYVFFILSIRHFWGNPVTSFQNKTSKWQNCQKIHFWSKNAQILVKNIPFLIGNVEFLVGNALFWNELLRSWTKMAPFSPKIVHSYWSKMINFLFEFSLVTSKLAISVKNRLLSKSKMLENYIFFPKTTENTNFFS